MKEHAKGLVEESQLTAIRDLLQGRKINLQTYIHTKPTEKGDSLDYLASALEADYPTIFTKSNTVKLPERQYLYFLTFATLHLTILQEPHVPLQGGLYGPGDPCVESNR